MYGMYDYGADDYNAGPKKQAASKLTVKLNKNAYISTAVKFGKSTSVNKMSQLKKKIHDV